MRRLSIIHARNTPEVRFYSALGCLVVVVLLLMGSVNNADEFDYEGGPVYLSFALFLVGVATSETGATSAMANDRDGYLLLNILSGLVCALLALLYGRLIWS